MVQPRCLYCGKALPAELLAAAEAGAAEAIRQLEERLPGVPSPDATPPREKPDRLLIVLDLREAEAATLARSLGLSAFEARQRLKRGGFQLHRIAPRAEALQDAERLAADGLRVVTLLQRELGADPVVVTGGRLAPGRLTGRTHAGRVDWSREDLLLVVKGPIQRQYQAEDKNVGRPKSAAPTDGYRFHLHRLSDPRPLELDPDGFDFDAERGRVASSLLRITAWMDAFQPAPLLDDCFRLQPPALGAADASGQTARALGRTADRKGLSVVLDNLRQFRFYSAWRGAAARVR